MSHVEHFVHLSPIRSTLLLNRLEEWRDRKHIVFHHSAILTHKVKHFGLSTTCAMHHTMYLRTQLIQQFLHHWSISTGRGEYQFSCTYRSAFHLVLQCIFTAIYEFRRHLMVETLRIFHGKILCKHIMASTRKSIASHATIVFCFVSGLSTTRKSYNHVSWANIRIVYHIATFHAACHCRIHNDSAHQIAYICCFSTRCINANSHIAHLLQKLICTIDDGRNHFPRNEHLVSAYRTRYQDVVHGTHTEQIVCIHDKSVLRNTFPYAQVARLFPIHVGKARFCSRTIRMHNVAICWVTP